MISFVFTIVIFATFNLGNSVLFPEGNYNPVAHDQSIVTFGNARITIFTDSLLRIEFKENEGKFEDRATLAVVNRYFEHPVKFNVFKAKNKLTIQTRNIQLEYDTRTTNQFAGLSIESREADKKSLQYFDKWYYGAKGTPLPGTIRSLDLLGPVELDCEKLASTSISLESLHCTNGLISKNGWVLWDDTQTPKLSSITGWWDIETIKGKEEKKGYKDLYFFGHGRNYKAALGDYMKIGGRIPMLPKYAFGSWWTRWYDLDQQEVLDMVNKQRMSGLPLDVFVFDMNWHVKNAWGAYTWDNNLYPSHQDTLTFLQKNYHLKVSANTHDANGVPSYEEKYNEMLEYLNLKDRPNVIEFAVCDNAEYALGVEEIIMSKLMNDGIDFWWIDYQQGGNLGGCKEDEGYNPTIWLNKIRATYHLRRKTNKRDMILARWGGLGNHRYQVGFGGDVDKLAWDRLAYQPYFAISAANVGYGYWSQDITGPAQEMELYVRWVQWAAFSPILRAHDRGMSAGRNCFDKFPSMFMQSSCAISTPWQLPGEYFQPARDIMRKRYELIPYIYNMARVAYDTGISLLRPMYYEYPMLEMAYATAANGSFAQYMFGDNLLVAPIVSPTNKSYGFLAEKEIWIPPGKWIERESGWVIDNQHFPKGRVIKMRCPVAQMPVFVAAGSVLPLNHLESSFRTPISDLVGAISKQVAFNSTDPLKFDIYPGQQSGEGYIYNDDGISRDYMQSCSSVQHCGQSKTVLTYKWDDFNRYMSINVTFPSKYMDRFNMKNVPFLQVRLVDTIFPAIVEAADAKENWRPIAYSRFGEGNSWYYDGRELATVLQVASPNDLWEIGPQEQFKTILISVQFIQSNTLDDFNNVRGTIANARLVKEAMDQLRLTPGSQTPSRSNIVKLAGMGMQFETLAGSNAFDMYIQLLNTTNMITAALSEIHEIHLAVQNDDEFDNRSLFATQLLVESQTRRKLQHSVKVIDEEISKV